MSRGVKLALGFVVAAIAFGYFFFIPRYANRVDREINISIMEHPISVSDDIMELHQRLIISDLHSDNLLWDRDLLERLDHGHVDIPRLIEGNVAVQVFDAVIKVPEGLNYESNTADTDQITKLAFANRWPISTWFSLVKRALHQAEVLVKAADRSNGLLTVIRSSSDLNRFLKERESGNRGVAGVLSVEGLHALEDDLSNMDQLFNAGYRILGLTHFFDNEVGGSSGGVDKGGLTEFGKTVIRRIEELNMIVDLAHASPTLIEDVLSITSKPVIVTHTGVKGIYESPRNLSDTQIRDIAETGGIIGIGFWNGALGDDISPSAIARSIRYVVNLVGVDHVGLGSDFDGATTISLDASGMVLITQALIDDGFSEDEIAAIMGGNIVRLFLEILPQ